MAEIILLEDPGVEDAMEFVREQLDTGAYNRIIVLLDGPEHSTFVYQGFEDEQVPVRLDQASFEMKFSQAMELYEVEE